MLLAVVEEAGCDAVDDGAVRDDEDAHRRDDRQAADECDALLTSGAVSVGDYDFVKVVLDRLSAERPGSAFTWVAGRDQARQAARLGTLGGVPVFGLPGNPVSSRVSFELFARPALRELVGRSEEAAIGQPVRAVAASAMPRRPDGKLHLDRVAGRRSRTAATAVSGRASRRATCSRGWPAANGLALLADGDGVEAGAEVDVLLVGPV